MDASYLENKILNLQARLKAEKEPSQREHFIRSMPPNVLSSPVSSSGRRPKQLVDMGTPGRSRKQLDLPVNVLSQPRLQENSEVDNKMKEIMKMNGILTVNGKQYYTDIKDLEHLGELGNGTCGQVVRMLHKPSQTVIAVKQMRRSGNSDENKRIIMDLDVVFKSLACPYIVSYLGCFITESDVWICMELMATCFDRLLKRLRTSIPEDILGKVTLATVKALHYLKECHGVIHRDVKPSNILLDERGNVKLCDFGISGRLVDSKAKTKNAGCAAYMAPERIEPPDPRKPDYDIRADVWSLGITLVELATGVFPYKDCKCDFEVLSRVLHEDPPSLPPDPTRFTPEFQNFVSSCLTKDYCGRPKYKKLLEYPFLKRYETKHVDVAEWYAHATSSSSTTTPLRYTPTSLSTVTRRQPPPAPPVGVDHRQNYQITAGGGNGNVVLNGNDTADKHSSSSFKVTKVYKLNGGIPSRWDHNNYNGNSYGDYSPLLPRRHLVDTSAVPVESNCHAYSNSNNNNNNNNNGNNSISPRMSGFRSENSSPLVLQRFHHQQMNQQHYYRSYPDSHHHNRSSSLSPSRRYITENTKLGQQHDVCCDHPPPDNTVVGDGPSKKRYSSYLKFHMGMSAALDDNRPTVPRPPSSRHHSPSPTPPSPPPRLSRLLSADSATNNNNNNNNTNNNNNGSISNHHHTLSAYKMAYLDSCSVDTQQSPSSSTSRLYEEHSPLMSKRYVSPPQPPPRRLSESSSVPGSPQHLYFRRNDLFRNSANSKYQYTPQPQRKAVYQINDL